MAITPSEHQTQRRDWLVWARWISIGYLLFAVGVFFVLSRACTSNPKAYLCMAPNEIGDLLAGVFAPLAFVWLAVAVLIQAQELSAQREELRLTRAEFENQRAVMMEQAHEARRQAEYVGEQTAFLRDQRDATLAAQQDPVFKSRLEGFDTHFQQQFYRDASYEIESKDMNTTWNLNTYRNFVAQGDVLTTLRKGLASYDRALEEGIVKHPLLAEPFEALLKELQLALDAIPGTSAAVSETARRRRLYEVRDVLRGAANRFPSKRPSNETEDD